VTPEELANLAHLRRARDLMDREYARPLDVAALARAALMSTAHFSRQLRATYGIPPTPRGDRTVLAETCGQRPIEPPTSLFKP
jgi:AraC-like DNA-binding protein